jgi:hypothetical protein
MSSRITTRLDEPQERENGSAGLSRPSAIPRSRFDSTWRPLRRSCIQLATNISLPHASGPATPDLGARCRSLASMMPGATAKARLPRNGGSPM